MKNSQKEIINTMKVKPTIAQQKYIDKAASKSKKLPKTQFRKDIEGAKKMIDSRKNYSDEKIMKKYGEAAFNAVSAEQY